MDWVAVSYTHLGLIPSDVNAALAEQNVEAVSYTHLDVYKRQEQGLADRYKSRGLDIALANGQNDNVLPVAATYIIDKSGKIKYAFCENDYKKRPSVKTLEANL